MSIYFKDNFFNAGRTDMMDRDGSIIGSLDLKSAFGSSLDVYNASGDHVCSGSFRFFSNKWNIADGHGEELGMLRMRMSFFTKKFEYDAGPRGVYEITSPAYSNEYEIADTAGRGIARFSRISGWLQPGAFELQNDSETLGDWELAALVMGIHQIRKRNNHAASSSH
ncbi:hypothetical protein PVOR_08965 [Paenibacillus vortex V453]|jgi:hypothetical protein|uniref:Uncharacterized protein n=2 Tax=Paenibacillus TaxID=44249 RepID=A0A163KLJ9_9BACL|nr:MULTISPECIES: hypothetical protein [Paenibacillus]ANA81285.1 hypothetical protein A3958_15465 [Paenibacillus glucanolyticus]AVV59984.1 hypothetical protein C7121_29605 [Paenibacillus glucanolyticus]EFU42393.1 hypothetical protein PVOR_08965 [Paenibacillus vortex V453]ETT35881.1 hypothetical protein C169_15934 [Paenibacillus sp. FSL R5-808]KZS47336.1 hypothetical protein AWU65_16085 [Paenibacillus glucanolyticus]